MRNEISDDTEVVTKGKTEKRKCNDCNGTGKVVTGCPFCQGKGHILDGSISYSLKRKEVIRDES